MDSNNTEITDVSPKMAPHRHSGFPLGEALPGMGGMPGAGTLRRRVFSGL